MVIEGQNLIQANDLTSSWRGYNFKNAQSKYILPKEMFKMKITD